MDNRLTRALDAYRSAWESVTTEIFPIRQDDVRREYGAVMALDGEVLARASVLVLGLSEPWSGVHTFVHFDETLPDARLAQRPRSGLEHQLRMLESQGRLDRLRKALQEQGIPVTSMTSQNGVSQTSASTGIKTSET
jgi:hypothetical protein